MIQPRLLLGLASLGACYDYYRKTSRVMRVEKAIFKNRLMKIIGNYTAKVAERRLFLTTIESNLVQEAFKDSGLMGKIY